MQHQQNKKVIYQTLVLRNLFLKKNLFIRSSSVVCITISLFSNTCKNKIQTHCFFYIQRKMWSKMWSKGDYIKKSNKFLHWTKWKLVLSFFYLSTLFLLGCSWLSFIIFPPTPLPFLFSSLHWHTFDLSLPVSKGERSRVIGCLPDNSHPTAEVWPDRIGERGSKQEPKQLSHMVLYYVSGEQRAVAGSRKTLCLSVLVRFHADPRAVPMTSSSFWTCRQWRSKETQCCLLNLS